MIRIYFDNCCYNRPFAQHLGIVESERFVTLIQREPFNYTEWRQRLFDDVPLDKFMEDAQQYSESLGK